MATVQETIEVEVPVSTAYNQWTQFEEFPKFMEGLTSVQQLDDATLRWQAEMAGQSREWTTEIVEQQPDERIAWKTKEGEVRNDGIVTFQPLGEEKTQVSVQMDVEDEVSGGVANMAADLMGVVQNRIRGDLERFKQLIENRGEETGAWRGEIEDGEVQS
jgi:uncharacterized membrane protein